MNNAYNLSSLDRIAEALEVMSGISTLKTRYVVDFNYDSSSKKWVMDKKVPEVYGAIGKGINVIGRLKIDDGTRNTWFNVSMTRHENLDADPEFPEKYPEHEEYELCFFGNDQELIHTFDVWYKPEDGEQGYKKDSSGNLIYETEITFGEYVLTPNTPNN